MPSVICTDNSSSRDDSLASSNAARSLHWDCEAYDVQCHHLCTGVIWCHFLNQVCASLRLVHSCFLKIVSVQISVCVRVHVCLSAPEAINN